MRRVPSSRALVKMACAAAAAVGVSTVVGVGYPSVAQADTPTSVTAGRGRIEIRIPRPQHKSDERRIELLVDGASQCGRGPSVCRDAMYYDYLENPGPWVIPLTLPAGDHRIEVQYPGEPDVLDQVVTVQPPSSQQDLLDNWIKCFGLPIPTDPTVHCTM